MAKTARRNTKPEPLKATDLVPDDMNINRGTEEGAELINKSIDEVGFGRSIVVDRNDRIIVGNKTTAAAIEKGKTNIRVVETTGDELVVVKRTDLDLNSEKGRKLAILDNTTHHKNYVQDADVSEAICEEYNLNPKQYGLDEPRTKDPSVSRKQVIQAVKKTHILLSFPPERLVQVQAHLEKIMKVEGVEIEQSSN